ncbi:oligopeptide transporter, OPT family [Thermococcus cleftensis]|uniref:Oligopeptide transporter, OPT family n=1 Tax=Thermococcus cleftensis (strain DSM 27260 / KACC 17922 / CL1) TaxID=163003 RepID=I3ZTR5_THECF|nr:oligopeptide transporter, OPT family [Thermococcus cleftensis]AFL95099.1 oligopeptide transporter, OPT family [Thermococcus cleftensis]
MEMKPYIPPEKSLPEYTVKAFVLGVILSIVMGAANAYLGMYAGMTVSASIPAAVISMAILFAFKDRNILENNMVQTAASAGESLAAGVIFTFPALVVLGYYTTFPYYIVTIIAALGGSLGALFTIVLRRAFIVEEKLPYPEGTACAEVLIAGDKGGSHAKPILYGGIFGGLFKLFGSSGLWSGTVETAKMVGSRVYYFGSDLSAALIAVGYIVGLNIAFLVFLGGAIAWFIAIPLYAGQMNHGDMSALDLAWTIWSTKIRYMGVGAMVVGGLWSLIKLRKPIKRGIKAGLEVAKRKQSGEAILRTEEDLPLNYVLVLIAAFVIPLFLLYFHIIGSIGIAAIMAVILLIVGFLGSSIAGYLAGVVGSSNNPVSGITIMSLLFTAFVLKGLGLSGMEGMAATILVAAVICTAAAIAGDTMQDLATGYIVGATPKRQQIFEIVGTFFAALVMAPVLNLLIQAYGIAGTPTAKENALAAPQAFLMAKVTEGVFTGNLEWNMIYIGAGIAVALIILDEILARRGSRFRTPVMPVAVGIYLPLSLGVPIFIGGLVRHFVGKARGSNEESPTDPGVLGAAGLIAGEALMGIFFAALIVAGVAPSTGFSSNLLGMILLAGIAVWLYMTGRKK